MPSTAWDIPSGRPLSTDPLKQAARGADDAYAEGRADERREVIEKLKRWQTDQLRILASTLRVDCVGQEVHTGWRLLRTLRAKLDEMEGGEGG